MKERKHFNCLHSFYMAGKNLPDEYRLKYWDALMQYGFEHTVPEGTCVVAQSVLNGIIPVIDKSWAKSEAGQAGGKQSVSKTQANGKQTESKREANEKQNVSKQEANASKQEAEKGERRKEEGEKRKEDNPPTFPPKGRKTQIPEKSFFDLQYATDAYMDSDLAFEIFEDWAKATGYTYKDWNLAWKKACREWLPEKYARVQANKPAAEIKAPVNRPGWASEEQLREWEQASA